jgi:hypothetical protein
MVGFAALYPPYTSSLHLFLRTISLPFMSEPAQAIRAQAIGAFFRHRQPHHLFGAPARARWIAAERSAASRTVNLA